MGCIAEMHMFKSQSDLNGLYLFMELTSVQTINDCGKLITVELQPQEFFNAIYFSPSQCDTSCRYLRL